MSHPSNIMKWRPLLSNVKAKAASNPRAFRYRFLNDREEFLHAKRLADRLVDEEPEFVEYQFPARDILRKAVGAAQFAQTRCAGQVGEIVRTHQHDLCFDLPLDQPRLMKCVLLWRDSLEMFHKCIMLFLSPLP